MTQITKCDGAAPFGPPGWDPAPLTANRRPVRQPVPVPLSGKKTAPCLHKAVFPKESLHE